MPHSHTLDELLARWDEAYHNGRDLSAEELCVALVSRFARRAARANPRAEGSGWSAQDAWLDDRSRPVRYELAGVAPVTEQRYAIQSHLAKGRPGDRLHRGRPGAAPRGGASSSSSTGSPTTPIAWPTFAREREITARMQHPGHRARLWCRPVAPAAGHSMPCAISRAAR